MLLSHLQVLITGDNSSAVRSLSAVDRAVTRTSASMDLLGVKSAGRLAVATAGMGSALFTAAAGVQAFGTALAGLAGGAAVGSIGAIGAGATGIAAGFLAAGAGVGAWGALAYPTISRVTGAFGEYTKAVEDGRKALAIGDDKGVTAAVEAQGKALALLSPAQKTVVGELETLKTQWLSTAAVLERPTLSIFSTGLRTVADLMPRLVPLAAGVGDALQGVAFSLENGFKGDTFGRFLGALEAESPRAVSQFGEIGGNLAGALMNGFVTAVPTMRIVMAGLVGATERLEQAASGGAFASFLDYGVSMMGPFNALMGSLTDVVVNLGVGLAPLGGPALETLRGLADGLAAAFAGPGMVAFREASLTLLPLAGKALGALGGALGALLSAVAPLGPVVLEAITGLGNALRDAFASDSVAGFVSALAQMLPSLIPIATTLLDVLVQVGDGVMRALLPVLPALSTALQQLSAPVVALTTSLASSLVPVLLSLLPVVVDVVTGLADGLAPILPPLGAALAAIVADLEPLIPALFDVLNAALPLIPALVEVVGALVSGLAPAVLEVTQALVPFVNALVQQGLLPLLTALVPVMTQVGEGIGEWLVALTPLLPALQDVLLSALAAIIAYLPLMMAQFDQNSGRMLQLLNVVVPLAGALLELANVVLAPLASLLRGDVSGALEAGGDALYKFAEVSSHVVEGLMVIGRQMRDSMIRPFTEVGPAVSRAFSSAGSWLYEGGRSLITGLLRGVQSLASKPWELIKSMGSQLIDGFKSMFGIHSPSRVMAEMGGHLTEGLLGGIEGGQRDVLSAWSGLGSKLTAPVSLNASVTAASGTVASSSAPRTVGGMTIEAPHVHIYGASNADEVWAQLEPKLDEYYGGKLDVLRQMRGGR